MTLLDDTYMCICSVHAGEGASSRVGPAHVLVGRPASRVDGRGHGDAVGGHRVEGGREDEHVLSIDDLRRIIITRQRVYIILIIVCTRALSLSLI